MFAILAALLRYPLSWFRPQHQLAWEVLALRHQLNLTSYWNERKAYETGVVPISSGYTLGFWRGCEERCQAQFL